MERGIAHEKRDLDTGHRTRPVPNGGRETQMKYFRIVEGVSPPVLSSLLCRWQGGGSNTFLPTSQEAQK